MSESCERTLVNLHLDGIEFDPVRVEHGFTVGGNYYITVGAYCFPEQGWYDCVSDLLAQWLPQLTSFAHGSTDNCKLCFLDGPAAVKLVRTNDRVAIFCYWDKDVEVLAESVDFLGFVNSVTKAARKYCRLVYQNGGNSNDTELIADYIQKLDKEIKNAVFLHSTQ